jgi:hypothetical protein
VHECNIQEARLIRAFLDKIKNESGVIYTQILVFKGISIVRYEQDH